MKSCISCPYKDFASCASSKINIALRNMFFSFKF